MTFHKKTVFIVLTATVFILIFTLTPKITNYIVLKKTADAIGVLPWQFGGMITNVTQCVITNPDTGYCGNCSAGHAQCGLPNYGCAGYTEIIFSPALGSQGPNIVCPIKGFKYSGGSPRSGKYILGGGAAPILPWVIGVSM